MLNMDNLKVKYEEVYTFTKTILNNEKINICNVVDIINKLIQLVENYQSLTGVEKKQLVMDTIRRVCIETYKEESDKEMKEMLLIMIDTTLSIMIDSLISAINGEFNFSNKITNNNINTIANNLFALFCFCNRYKQNTNTPENINTKTKQNNSKTVYV